MKRQWKGGGVKRRRHNGVVEPVLETTTEADAQIVEPLDATLHLILGSALVHNGVHLTHDQRDRLARWCGMDPTPWRKAAALERGTMEAFMAFGDQSKLMRLVEVHGVRLMAFLAGRRLLEDSKDPVESLARLLEDAGQLEEPYGEGSDEFAESEEGGEAEEGAS